MTKSELLAKLRSLKNESRVLADDTELYKFCRELFVELEIEDKFTPNELEELIGVVNKEIDETKVVEVFEELNKTNDNLGSKSLDAQELRELIRQLDEHEEKIGKEKAKREELSKQIEALKKQSPILAMLDEARLQKVLEERRELEEKNINNGLSEEVAEELAEKKILVKEQVREVAPEITDEAKINDLAEAIVNNEEVATRTAKIVSNEAIIEELVELGEQVMAEKIIKSKVEDIARTAVEEINEELKENTDKELSKDEEKRILQLIKERVEKAATNPLIKLTDPEVEKVGTKIVVGETVTDKIIGSIDNQGRDSNLGRTSKTVEQVITDSTNRAVNKASKSVDKLYADDGASASKVLLRQKTEELFSRGINPREIKSILVLRYPENSVSENDLSIKTLTTNGHSDGKHEEATGESNVIKQLLKSPRTISENITKVAKVSDKLSKVKGMEPLLKVTKTLEGNKKLSQGMEMIRKYVQFNEKLNGFTGGSLSQVGKLLKIPALENFGQTLLTRFGGEMGAAMATHVAKFGLENGIKSILGELLKTGTVKAIQAGAVAAAEGATLAAGEAALAGAAVATGPPGWVIGLVLMAADFVRKVVVGLFSKVKDKFLDLIESTGLVSEKTVNGLIDGAKKIGGGIVVGLGVIGTAFMAGLAGLGSAFAIIGPVLAIVIVSLLGYNMFQTASTQISPLIINKEVTAGVCIPLEDIGSTGAGGANCNPNAPATNAISVTKANFVNVAERWRAGGGKNAEKCFNDVVCRAKSAGINPDYALWAWLHESGASNYTGFPSVSDFGIIYVPKNNFVAQIEAFLKLDPASGCMGKNGITDYWLAFAANYLNGSDNCDPDFLNVSSNITPRQYLEEMKSTWNWISSSPMPSSIHITPEKCGDGSNSGTIITGPDGKKMICENTGDNSATSPFDPNAPGLPGITIPGQCSVADKVVLTKQCQGPWATKPLPRGGTICQAGCGPTSVSMMLRHGNGSWTPDAIIYAPGSAYSSMGSGGSSMNEAYLTLVKQFGGGAVTYDGSTRSCDEKAIGQWICAGKVVMVLEYAYTGSGQTGHFLLAVAVQNGKIVVADPYFNEATPFDGGTSPGHAAKIRECMTINASAIK